MMLGKHGSANLQEERTFQAKYMGCTGNSEPGIAGIDKAVKKIHNRNKNEDKLCSKITIEVSKEGMTFFYAGCQKKQFFAIKDISYCSLNRFDTSIFAFNHHISKSPVKVECHAVLCNTEDKAKSIGQALYSSYREGHFEELRNERKKRVTNQDSKNEKTADSTDKPNDSNVNDGSVKASCATAVLDTELECIVQDMLDTVEREKESMEEQGRTENN